jgi:FMN phosphatase YigB (HAD superfamily)
MIRNIVFDMGQVLLPFDGAEHAARYTQNARTRRSCTGGFQLHRVAAA